MKETLLNILSCLLALAQCPKENEEEAAKVQGFIDDAVKFATTAHGDSELADPDVQEAINDLSVVLGSSQPDPEHAEVPQFEDEETTEEQPAEETEEEKAAREEAEAAEAQAAEEAAAEEERLKAEAAKPKAKVLTIKEKRAAAERAEQAAQPQLRKQLKKK